MRRSRVFPSDDQLVNENGEATPTADSSPADATHDLAETNTADSDASSAAEGSEHQVPLRHLLEERRRRAEAERELRDLRSRASAIEQERALFEQARPEIQRIMQEREELQAKQQELTDELEMLRETVEHAKSNGYDPPQGAEAQIKRLAAQLNRKLSQLDALPNIIDQRLQAVQAQNDQKTREQLARQAFEVAMSKFDSEWASVVKSVPEWDGDEAMRDVAFARWQKDGGQKPVSSYFAPVIKAAAATKVKEQAKQQVTAASAPRPAIAGSQGTAPRASAPEKPTSWAQFWDSVAKSI